MRGCCAPLSRVAQPCSRSALLTTVQAPPPPSIAAVPCSAFLRAQVGHIIYLALPIMPMALTCCVVVLRRSLVVYRACAALYRAKLQREAGEFNTMKKVRVVELGVFQLLATVLTALVLFVDFLILLEFSAEHRGDHPLQKAHWILLGATRYFSLRHIYNTLAYVAEAWGTLEKRLQAKGTRKASHAPPVPVPTSSRVA